MTTQGPDGTRAQAAAAAVRAGLRRLGPRDESTSAISAADAARAVADRGVRIVVVTLGEIRCSGGGLPAVVDATGGDCVDTDTVTVGAQLPEVVARLRGGG
jgi:hypothetical protein